MAVIVAFFGFAFFVAVAAYGWRSLYLRSRLQDRLGEPTRGTSPMRVAFSPRSPIARRWWWLPWVLAPVAGVIVWLVLAVQWPFFVSATAIVGLLGSQLEAWLSARRRTRLETQLVDAIDIMVGGLGAGGGVTAAMEAAIEETQQPLRSQLEHIVGRIRLGDEPHAVFASLAERIPLETFLLFTSALAVHWEVGGSLAPTLATVGRTIRDRIEITRRINSNTAQSQVSTLMILGLTYFIALIVYFNGPDQMREFVATSIGSFLAAGSILLQAVGIVWMSYISRIRF